MLLVTSLKLLTEIALLALLGQGVLAWLAGPQRQSNVFYLCLRAVTRPVMGATRWIWPRGWSDTHRAVLTAAWLLGLWLALVVAKVGLCLERGLEVCR